MLLFEDLSPVLFIGGVVSAGYFESLLQLSRFSVPPIPDYLSLFWIYGCGMYLVHVFRFFC